LVITPSTRQLANPSSQGGRAAASTVAALSLWICGRRAHTAQRAFRPPAAHNSTGSTTTAKLPINELHHPLKFQKRQKTKVVGGQFSGPTAAIDKGHLRSQSAFEITPEVGVPRPVAKLFRNIGGNRLMVFRVQYGCDIVRHGDLCCASRAMKQGC
jgi:hypothetical protein